MEKQSDETFDIPEMMAVFVDKLGKTTHEASVSKPAGAITKSAPTARVSSSLDTATDVYQNSHHNLFVHFGPMMKNFQHG
jgi:hypothetical protein